MFVEVAFLEHARAKLLGLPNAQVGGVPNPQIWWDDFVSKSLLKKAIRRGETQSALLAAKQRLASNERGLWKRLCVIALDDVGVANLPLVCGVLLAEQNRSPRTQMGGSSIAALALANALCTSPKDRSTDDLIDALVGSEQFPELKARTADLSFADSQRVVASQSASIHEGSTAAIHLSTDLDTFSTGLTKGHRWCRTVHLLPEDVSSPCTKAVALLAIKRTRSIMAPFLALLSRDLPESPSFVEETYPARLDLHGLPSWVLDGHTRLGLKSFSIYHKRSLAMRFFFRHGQQAASQAPRQLRVWCSR